MQNNRSLRASYRGWGLLRGAMIECTGRHCNSDRFVPYNQVETICLDYLELLMSIPSTKGGCYRFNWLRLISAFGQQLWCQNIKGALWVYGHGKNGFVTATKLGTTGKIFVAATKNFAAATKTFC